VPAIHVAHTWSLGWTVGSTGGDALWSLRQKLDSPRQADRRLGQSNAQKRLFDRPGLSTFSRNDNKHRLVCRRELYGSGVWSRGVPAQYC